MINRGSESTSRTNAGSPSTTPTTHDIVNTIANSSKHHRILSRAIQKTWKPPTHKLNIVADQISERPAVRKYRRVVKNLDQG
ncbi:uncharacterized protein BKA55DRAFT_578227 [Fusarium redolens]|uniref:Uncharacterized protein n=1 Tax=Fusarium redolens TaxID=48865 RepID=A0A9P9GDV2_FUSRE|nr:uncharacterized protein BKA55DRAFT_578227 [Fusarium redolens]KAH7237730.1 hypothetical protein BKA55DRAFT_578227 [Fusarium redolens]